MSTIFPSHYYGDIVRKLFLAGGIIMLVTLPFVQEKIPISVQGAIVIILAIDVFAGITNPLWKWIAASDSVISLAAFCFFSYYAVTFYVLYGMSDIFFWTNSLLSVIFFFALYFATKTLRGKLTK